MRGRDVRIVALALLLVSTRAVADSAPELVPALPHLITLGPRKICMPDVGETPGRCRWLPAGHFLDEPAWSMLDAETRRLQDQETRLGAENAALRRIAAERDASWQPGWKTLAATLVVGLAGGIYVHSKF